MKYIRTDHNFVMDRYITLLYTGESHYFVRVNYPDVWKLDPKERAMTPKEFNQYTEVKDV